MYALQISRYNLHLTFETREDFEKEVKRYFTPGEIRRGSPLYNRLISFDAKRLDKDKGYVRNDWQDMSTFWYPDI